MRTYFPSTVFGLVVAVVAFCGSSRAMVGLTWEKTSKSLTVESGTGSITYGFRNDGPNDVQITAVKSSCDCVTARSSVKNLAPGKTAVISAVFHGENHLGSEDRTIAVVSVSGTDQKVELLKLHVDIRPSIVLDPPILTWAKDEMPQAKMVWVKSSRADQGAVSIKQIQGGEPDFKVSLNTSLVTKGTWFMVIPVSTAEPRRSLIRVTVQRRGQVSSEVIMYAVVRPD